MVSVRTCIQKTLQFFTVIKSKVILLRMDFSGEGYVTLQPVKYSDCEMNGMRKKSLNPSP